MQAGCQITAHTHVHGFQLRSFLFEEIKIFPYGNGLDRQQGFLAQNVDNNLLHQRKQVRIRLRSGTGSHNMTVCFGAVDFRRIHNDIANLLTQYQHFLVGSAAQVKAQIHFVANCIQRTAATLEASRLNIAAQQRIGMQRVHRVDDSRPHINGVHTQVRLGTVGRFAPDFRFN